MTKLEILLQRRVAIVSQMRALADKAELSQEEANSYDQYERELDEVESSIKREERLSKVEEALRMPVDTPTIEVKNSDSRDSKEDSAKRYAEAFEKFLRMPMAELDSQTRAVLNTGTGSEGGYLVPESYLTTVINKLLEINVVRQVADVIQTSSTTNIPLGVGRPSFAIVAENGAFGTTDASFGQVVLGAYKLGGIVQASDELIQDSFINLEQYLTNLIVEGIADAEETYFTTGTGSSQATGFLVGGTLGKTTAATAAVTVDEILDLKYALKAPYRMNANFMMNSSTELAIRKLKDSNGQYLWQPSIQVGAPNVFDGKSIYINEKMPSLGTGNKFMAFGDFKYFKIGDRGGLEIKKLSELYAGNGQIGWRVAKRFDSKVTQSEAIQYAKNA